MAKKKKVGTKVPSLKELEKRYGNSLVINAQDKQEHGLSIPFRSFALTYLAGTGVPYGKIVEFMGEENSGKSMAALDLAYVTQQLGGHVIWDDAEQAWDNSWAEQNGVDPAGVTLLNDTQIETISDASADLAIYWRNKLTNNEPILLVIDSVAALDCEASIDSKMMDAKADMGTRAKALGKMFRIRSELWYKLGITVVCINQYRKKIGVMYGDDNTTPGGKALGFHASIRLAFFSGKTLTTKYKGQEPKIGKLVTVRVIKNKVAPSRESLKKMPIYFTDKYGDQEIGFDRYFNFDNILIQEDVLDKKKGGSVLSYNGKVVGRGTDSFIKKIEDDDKLRRKLLRKAGINTIGTTRKALEDINYNMFPISEDTSYESQVDTDYGEEENEE